MKLLKFGGTSLANAEKFLHVSEIIEKNNKSEKIAVVLSAPAKVTNYLSLIIEKIIQNKKVSENEVLETINLTETLFLKLIKNISKIQSNFSYQTAKEAIKKEFYHLKNIIHGVNLLEYFPDKIKAIIISRGEILSVCIMQTILQSKNYNITIIDPVKNLISTGSYLESTVNIDETKKRISKIIIKKNSIILMSGFIAGNQKNELVVLGRNGSDYSAAILAACFNANSCEIWTDVDGVFTCDPRITSNAHLLKSISYEETMELSYFGAKVLHPRTIEPLAQFKIPCFIKNTNNITFPGTIIYEINQSEKNFLKGVTHLNNIAILNVSGTFIKLFENIITRIFHIILKNHIKVILMNQSSSDNKISFCILQDKINTFLKALNEEFRLELENTTINPFELKNNLSIIAIIGSNIYKKNNVTSKIFSCLGSLKINVITIAQGSSKHSISIVIKNKYALKAVKSIHNVLFYNKKIIHIFLIGIGGIGKTLLKQIFIQKNFLLRKNIEIKICLIANSKKFLFSTSTINLSNWKELFQKSKEKFTLESLETIMKNNNFMNSVLVDCTSDQILSEKYVNFLHHDFHVVTSNKKANTNKWSYYYKIKKTAFKKNKKFLYETNVGAGLPVIETIQNLINTGDYLIYFTGILSGSLSFIFGKLEENIPLSQAVQEAMDLGFTEPDPRDDLSGMDVARKLLILAREFGYKTELHEIKVEPLLPKIFKKCKSLDHFFIELKNLDLHFSERMKKARDFGKVLRFIGTIESTGKCFVRIEEVDINNPLYKVKNGENALAFYTNYYKSIPLVLRGYGAGKNVTASGVFSDLLRTLS